MITVGAGSVISAWALHDVSGWLGALDMFILGSVGFVILALCGYLATSPDGARAALNRLLHRHRRN